ncbi:glycosyltransferase family 9 protein [candidate division KSB1 bacterium]|nr:MAG: glycosyltransferase family 9 protein [candidate division KSB1 bacterium]
MTYIVHRNCRHFRGDIPCKPHKRDGVICENCLQFDPIDARICIIKLAAAGDVIRTTPLLRKLRSEFPHAWITWVTETPDVIPTRAFDPNGVDEVLRWGYDAGLIVEETPWDWVILLDKDRPACVLSNRADAKKWSGFGLSEGRPIALDEAAHIKFLTGIDDKLNRANTLSYPQEIFRMCGYEWKGEEYVLDPCLDQPLPEGLPEHRPLIGLNTGCAPRWKTRLWPEHYWTELSLELKRADFGVLLLGGPIEHEKNLRIAAASGATYLGHFPLKQFVRLVGQIDLMVTAVTMAMHVAIGLQKRLVLFNNIFNAREFELYKRGEILEPDPPCTCTFVAECPLHCMERIKAERVLDAVKRQAARL